MTSATRRKVAILWSMLVAGYFLWEAEYYRGLYQWLAELQIAWFGWYMPMLTFGILALVFILLGAFVVLRWTTSTSRRAGGEVAQAALLRARLMHLLFGLGVGLVLVGACIPIWAAIRLPAASHSATTLTLGSTAPSFPAEGPTRLDGIVSTGRVALYGQWWPRTMSHSGFSPVFTVGSDDRIIRYFVQLSPAELGHQPPAVILGSRTGYLVRGEMPGTVLALYRHGGYRVVPDYYTLYASKADLRRSYYVLAAQFMVSGLIVVLLALWQRRYDRKMRSVETAALPVSTAV